MREVGLGLSAHGLFPSNGSLLPENHQASQETLNAVLTKKHGICIARSRNVEDLGGQILLLLFELLTSTTLVNIVHVAMCRERGYSYTPGEAGRTVCHGRGTQWIDPVQAQQYLVEGHHFQWLGQLARIRNISNSPAAGARLVQEASRRRFRILNIEQYEASGTAAAKRHSCRLSTHKLSSFPNEDGYAAVSYTWKSRAQRWNFGLDHASVEVQGQAFPAAARVAPMLASLYESGFRNFWIDALCINPLDVSERSNQVALMRQIYSNASHVVVFLGSGSPSTDALFDFLNHGSIKGLRMSSSELSSLLEVVSDPYWQRAWIIQEVAVARSVVLICGAKRTSWDRLVHSMARWDVSEWARPISSGSDFPGREIGMIDNVRTERHGSLIEVLQKTRSSKASNALDVIYAKLGLANDASALVSRVTYSIDASALFKSIVKRHVTAKHDLYIICLVRERQEDGVHLPSWVPDWTKSTNR